MHEELLVRAEGVPACGRGILALVPLLPPAAEGLDAVLAEAIAQRRPEAFVRLARATLVAGRRLDAVHLVGGAALCEDPMELALLAGHAQGDLGASLVAAVRGGAMGWEREAAALFLVAWWGQERCGGALADGLVTEARVLARKAVGPETQMLLLALAQRLADAGLDAVTRRFSTPHLREGGEVLGRSILAMVTVDVLADLPEEPPPVVLSGYTVRRAVPRVGRNDPCPCGSGRKHKHCCADKDQERLRDSSEVPGVTRSELQAQPERHLTWERLRGMHTHELARLDPARIPAQYVGWLVSHLTLDDELGAVLRILRTVEDFPDRDARIDDAIDMAADLGRVEALRQLLAFRRPGSEEPGLLPRLLVLDGGLCTSMRLVEEAARSAVDHPVSCVDLGLALLRASPALGMLVARGALISSGPLDREVLLERLLETRDRLEMPPVDVVEDVLWALEDEGQREDEWRQVEAAEREALQEKNTQVAELRSQVAKLMGELSEREKALARATRAAAAPAAPVVGPAQESSHAAELHRRVAELRKELVQRHAERNQLRREVERLRASQEAVSGSTPATDLASAARDDEDSLLLPEEAAETRPVLVPVFLPHAREALRGLPPRVARLAVDLAGRLAAGQPAAWAGARRLRLDREIWRQRLAREYRVLFRTGGGELVVLEIVLRRDLERAIRALT